MAAAKGLGWNVSQQLVEMCNQRYVRNFVGSKGTLVVTKRRREEKGRETGAAQSMRGDIFGKLHNITNPQPRRGGA